jgi:hypothetical protein
MWPVVLAGVSWLFLLGWFSLQPGFDPLGFVLALGLGGIAFWLRPRSSEDPLDHDV